MRKIKNIIGYLVYIFLIILSPIIKIRFGFIYSSRIGHLGFNIDNYLTLTKNNKRQITIMGYQKNISNIFLFNIWKKNKKLFFSNKFLFVYNQLSIIDKKHKFILDYDKELHPKFSTTILSERNIGKIEDKDDRYKNFLKKYNINGPYICIHNRDEEYMKYKKLDDYNIHTSRNFSFDDYSKAINYLISKNYYVVRIGKYKENHFKIIDKRFVEISDDESDGLLELLLIKNCFFFIGCNTGISIIPRLFRKSMLLINCIPLDVTTLSAFLYNSIFIPKKIKDLKSNKLLSFRDMFVLNYDIHHKGDFFEKNNLKVINNSSDEILDAVIEMENLKKQNLNNISEESKKLQKIFWKSLSKITYVDKIKDILKIKISNNFLIKNKELIK